MGAGVCCGALPVWVWGAGAPGAGLWVRGRFFRVGGNTHLTSLLNHLYAPTCYTVYGGGGVWGTTCLCSFRASAAQKWKFPKMIFLML